jgi:hypothetical protein
MEGGRKTVYEPNFDDAGVSAADYRPAGGMRRIESKEIFRELIAQEVRSGRLSPSRRRRIVRYAAQLRLSAVETGRLIAECRDEALESEDPEEIYHALRLVEPPPKTMPIAAKVAVALTVAIVLYDLAARLF